MSSGKLNNFLGLDEKHSRYSTARFAVLPIPYDSTTRYAVGTREGPAAIIHASQQVELYDDALGREAYRDGVATLPDVECDARGPEQTIKAVYEAAQKPVKDGKFLLGLGGEHSITSGLVRAVAARYKNLSVLQIDAHADLRDEYQGSPYSHAAVMRRIHDMKIDAVGVGIRNYSAEESRFIKSAGKPLYSARTCRDAKGWIDEVVSMMKPQVYVTIDIDGFDPAYAPGTGTPEPGGLDWFQVNDLLSAISKLREVVAADIVEVRPIPPNHVTEFLAARLAYRLIGLVSRRR
ncbi:MAG: agmatinase [Phycisphaerales bacterium]|nr:agmatinase [Phycisphaerales bacterium]